MSDQPIRSEKAVADEFSTTKTKRFVGPSFGEQIGSLATGNTYTIGEMIGEGYFGTVFACTDVWNNYLATKALKPRGTYERVRASTESELEKLRTLRITFFGHSEESTSGPLDRFDPCTNLGRGHEKALQRSPVASTSRQRSGNTCILKLELGNEKL